MANANGGLLAVIAAGLAGLPGWAQVTAAAVAIGGGTVGVYRITEPFHSLPERVQAIEDADAAALMLVGHETALMNLRVVAILDSLGKLSGRVDLVICLQEAQAGQHGYEQCAR